MSRSLTLCLVAALAVACGGEEEPEAATFTSDVVQRETCRVTGDSEREACTREVVTQRLRVTVVEDERQRVWISGVPRDGAPGRSLLGTRDQLGGYLFYDERVQLNAASGCRLTDEITLALRVEEGADPESIGVDDCLALVGRETRVTTTSPECDDVNDPPAEVRRIVRRRWEPSAGCEAAQPAGAEG